MEATKSTQSMAIKEETVEHHFAQKGKGNCFFCGEVRERIGVS